MTRAPALRSIPLAVALSTGALAACGSGDSINVADTRSTAPRASTVPVAASDPPTTSPSTDAAPTTEVQAPTTAADNDEFAAEIEAILTAAIAPGAIPWNRQGVNAPPTAAVAAIRIPNRDDVLVGVGTNVDGTPVQANAPFAVGALGNSMVQTIAYQMIDEGLLDPTHTVDQWAPTLPNSDRVTVQMLLDGETGWVDRPITPDPIISDFERAWTMQEVVDLQATTMAAIGEPGTPSNDASGGDAVLGLIVEKVGGLPLAGLVRDRVTDPAGLDDTYFTDGTMDAADVRDGVIVFNGSVIDASQFVPVSFLTWLQASHAVISTPTDLLDLLDSWVTGEQFTTDRTPTSDRFVPDPDGNPDLYIGQGIPVNGYCPCTEINGGVEPSAVGRSPAADGTRAFLLHYADGISILVNVNSNEAAFADIKALTDDLHVAAAAAR